MPGPTSVPGPTHKTHLLHTLKCKFAGLLHKPAYLSGVAVAVAAATVCGTVLIPNQAENKYNTAVYIKGDSMYTLSLSEKDAEPRAMQVLSDDAYDITHLNYLMDILELSTTLSKDGSKLFYCDSINSADEALYYLDLEDENAVPVRISGGNVWSFFVNESATIVTFLRNGDTLYQYDMQSGKTEKIASEVLGTFMASRDGSKIAYNTKSGLYLRSELGHVEKLSNSGYRSRGADDMLSTIYYADENNTLFCNKTGKAEDSFKIADNVSGVSVSGNGVYYTTDNGNVSMYDYIDEDLLSVDPDSLERPEYPFSFEYDTDAEYRAAMEQYEADMEVYEHANDLLKLKEDLLSDQYRLETLHYFDGSQSSVVTEDVMRDHDFASPVVALEYTYPDPEKAAALTADDLEAIIESSDSSASWEIYNKIRSSAVAVNGTAYALDLNVWTINPSEDGQTVYITTKNPDNSDIDLYQAGISGNSLQTPTQIASDIDDLQIIGNNAVFWQDSAVFVNGVRIDDDVHSHVAFRDDGSFVYLVGEEDDNSYQLKSYKDGEITTIADDVFDFGFTTGGDLLYLRDYNLNRCAGTLYLYNGKDSTKLDDDVAAIVPGEILADSDSRVHDGRPSTSC